MPLGPLLFKVMVKTTGKRNVWILLNAKAFKDHFLYLSTVYTGE